MSEYYEQEWVEPDSAFALKDGKAEVKIQFTTELLERAATDIVQNHIDINFMPLLNKAMNEYFKMNGYNDFGSLIKETVREEFIKRYPDVVENKVNEIAEYVKKMKPEDAKDWRWDSTAKTIGEMAKKKVEEYINNELSKEIKVTKEWLETFSRNYFANNLFRAMGMMDKMLPVSNFENK